jgi:hypothetical protein
MKNQSIALIEQAEKSALEAAAVVADQCNMAAEQSAALISSIVNDDDGQASAEQLAIMYCRRVGIQPSERLIAAVVAVITAQNAVDNAKAAAARAAMQPKAKTRKETLVDEWEAAWAAAPRHETLVHDEDGGSSLAIRIVRGWTYKGCEQHELYRFLECDEEYCTEKAKENKSALVAAKEFVASIPTLPAGQAKTIFYGLTETVQASVREMLTRRERQALL